MTVKCQLCGCDLFSCKKKSNNCYTNEQGLTVCEWCLNNEIIEDEKEDLVIIKDTKLKKGMSSIGIKSKGGKR